MFKYWKALCIAMIKNGFGGAKTQTGLRFEKRIDISALFKKLKGYSVQKENILFNGEKVAELYKKHGFYKKFLETKGIVWKEVLSKQLLPDQVVFVVNSGIIYVVEIKFQVVEGSVDEKLQTCDFKKKHYEKLVAPLNLKVEYAYVLNDWFKDARYKDTLNYIKSVSCHYFFNELPLKFLGLPLSK
jgi:hypothetical protein